MPQNPGLTAARAVWLPVGGVEAPGSHSRELSRSVYSGSVTSSLREAIIGGQLPEGTPLVERRLADQFGMSRGPVRSALAVLEGEGLVTTLPNGRTVASKFDLADVSDLLAVRYHLESTAVLWGSQRQASLQPVEHVLGDMEAEGTSSQRLVDLDIHFHRMLLELSGSRFLLQSWLAIAPVLHTVITLGNRELVGRDPESNFHRIIDSHRRIVTPLQSGDHQRAMDHLADQFQFTGSMFDPGAAKRSPGQVS